MENVNRIDPWQRIDPTVREVDIQPNTIGIQRILVPVDFSVCTAEALRYAGAFAKQFGAIIHLLHVVQLNIAGEERGIPRTGLIRQMGQAARSALQKLVQVLWDGKIPTLIMIREGRPSEVILQEARDANADLVIMGTCGHPGFLSFLRRTTTARVVRQASCPVLVLPVGKRDFFSRRGSKSAHLLNVNLASDRLGYMRE